MYALILGNLDRQARALDLLAELLEEEFSLLIARETGAVMDLEFSIHELLRQLAVEKEEVIRRLGGGKVLDYAQMLPEEEGGVLRALWARIDEREQACARQATHNTELSLGLMDQSTRLLDFLHKRILPPQEETYGRKGRFIRPHPAPSLLSGRL
jgi:flagellar biosynthesis/type III secretory pathway chaperone